MMSPTRNRAETFRNDFIVGYNLEAKIQDEAIWPSYSELMETQLEVHHDQH